LVIREDALVISQDVPVISPRALITYYFLPHPLDVALARVA